MLLKQEQKGMTFLGYAIVLGVIGFFAVMAMKLAPLYLEYQSVVRIMNNVAEQNASTTSPAAIREAVQKQFYVNNIDRVTSKDIVIKRDKGTTVMSVDYEARTRFAGSLWFLVVFDHSVTLRGA